MYTVRSLLAVSFALYLSLVVAHPLQRLHRRSPSLCTPGPAGKSLTVPAPNVSAKSLPSQVAVQHSTSSSISRSSLSSSSSSSSSSASLPSSSTVTNSGGTGALGALFPISQTDSWTTSPLASNPLPLSDQTFRPTNVLKALSHNYVNAPDGKPAMQAHYPKGSYNFGHSPQGGFSFYAPGPQNVDLTTAKEATFGYSVFFEQGFDWVLGGKLPGLYGGDTEALAVGCSGGSRSDACFSSRLMWRTAAEGELYTYLPPYTDPQYAANKKQCSVAPLSVCNPTYGASVGRGSFLFKDGQWTTVSQRVKLNDVGQANGELELFVNGNSVINVTGLILRARDVGRIRGIQAQTFFGGSTSQFASTKDTNVWFSDFSVAITQLL